MNKKAVLISILVFLILLMVWVFYISIDRDVNDVDKDEVITLPKDLNSIRILANEGNHKAQNELGNIYANGALVKQSFEKAKEWYEKAAASGSAEASYNLGTMYQNAIAVDQDYKKALEYYKKASDLGNSEAKENIKIICEENKELCK